jgi:hypothetical protein
MEIVESGPRKILIKLDFLKPFEAHNMGEFLLEPKATARRSPGRPTGPVPICPR